MKILDSYYNMHVMLNKHNYATKQLQQDTVYTFKNKTYHIPAGACVLDIEEDEMAKILYMNACVDKAYRGGAITSEQIRQTVERAYSFKEEKYEQGNIDFAG